MMFQYLKHIYYSYKLICLKIITNLSSLYVDEQQVAKQYVLRSLDYNHNYRSTVIRDAYRKEYESTKKMVNEWHRKGFVIDEHLAGYLDGSSESREEEEGKVEDGDDDANDFEDDDESCFHEETNSLFNRYKLAAILIEYEFLRKNYE